MPQHPTPIPLRGAYQDGPTFYDEETGGVVAFYPSLVAHDYDVAGAQRAREQFLRDHPRYRAE